MFVKVVLDVPLDKEFDYSVPPDLEGLVNPGQRVWVEFGRRRMIGYITSIVGHPSVDNPSCILKIIDKRPLLTPELMELGRWISEYYCCRLVEAYNAMLPGRIRWTGRKKQTKRYVRVIGDREELQQSLIQLRHRAHRQADILEFLLNQATEVPFMDIIRRFHTGPGVVNALWRKGLIDIYTSRIDRDPYRFENFQPSFPYVLTAEQKKVYNVIKDAIDKGRSETFLLMGVTGSGKTEVYLQIIDYILSLGKGAIMIVPEISLTPQTVERLKSRFRENVAVLHSRLSGGEREDQWMKVYNGIARIVVGARSAIFAPVRNLGVIVVDEEHERTYKQEDTPRYHAKEVAVKRAQIEGAVAILGSATPSLESYYKARCGRYTLLTLKERIDHRPLAAVRVIDMREEIKKTRRYSIFSTLLLQKIRDRLERHQQIILFLNRRGFSPFLICRKCGYIIKCPHCSIALTYHQVGSKLLCHWCEHSETIPAVCPECGSGEIRFSGIGTQKIESTVAKFFPSARIRRMDTDVTHLKGIHKEIFDSFRRGTIDILVGTQMIAKGLDFPNVTLVGVISADVALHLPDFRSSEYTFQLLTQVAGRAGRGDLPGEVIIQTLTPQHPAIIAAVKQDYVEFAQRELSVRKELLYPPFVEFINIIFRSRNPQKSELIARHFRAHLGEGDFKVFGPIPAAIGKLRGYYRWHIILKVNEEKIPEVVNKVKMTLSAMGRHPGVVVTVDVGPANLL